jgi:hypothetical protein
MCVRCVPGQGPVTCSGSGAGARNLFGVHTEEVLEVRRVRRAREVERLAPGAEIRLDVLVVDHLEQTNRAKAALKDRAQRPRSKTARGRRAGRAGVDGRQSHQLVWGDREGLGGVGGWIELRAGGRARDGDYSRGHGRENSMGGGLHLRAFRTPKLQQFLRREQGGRRRRVAGGGESGCPRTNWLRRTNKFAVVLGGRGERGVGRAPGRSTGAWPGRGPPRGWGWRACKRARSRRGTAAS